MARPGELGRPGELALSCNPSYLGGQNCGMAGSGKAKDTRRKEFCGRTKVPLMGTDQPRRSDSNDERRSGYTRQYQKPEFESQPDPVLNTVIVLKGDLKNRII